MKIFFKYLSQKGQFRHKEKNNNSKGGTSINKLKKEVSFGQKNSMDILENRA